jgi:hypothetical protein
MPDDFTAQWFAELKVLIDVGSDSSPNIDKLRAMLARLPRDIRPAAQAAATRRAAVNLRGHINNLLALLAQGKRPKVELYQQLQWLPALLAAANTLEKIEQEPQ